MTEPSTIDIIEPRQRSYTVWTPDLLRAAEIVADGGQLRLAADLCETMFADDRIKAVVDTRTDALLGLPLSFEGKSKRPIRKLELEEDWWSMFPETELKMLHAWGVMLGVGVAFMPWKKKGADGTRDVPRLHVLHPRNLEWSEEDLCWYFTARDGRAGTKKVRVTPGDGNWILYTPYGSTRPWAFGAYRALSRWALLKQYALSDWGSYSERHGHGILMVSGAEGTVDQRRAIAADLANLGRKTTLALPKGFDMKLVEAMARTWDTFKAQIEAADNGAAVTLLGQNLTTQAPAGGGGLSMHGKVSLGRTKSDAETMSTTLHDQALIPWADDNFGNPAAAPWPCWNTTPTGDLKERAAVRQMDAQADATLVQGGIATPNEMRARNGLPPIEGGDLLRPANGGGQSPASETTGTTTDEQTEPEPTKTSPASKPGDDDEEAA